jgi:hypothetical protein
MVWMALTIVSILELLRSRVTHARLVSVAGFGLVTLAAMVSLKPGVIAFDRSANNDWRNAKIHNTRIYKTLDDRFGGRAILNCRGYDEIEVMFHARLIAVPWFPEEPVLDSLQGAGYAFATFRGTAMPAYVIDDSSIVVIPDELW